MTESDQKAEMDEAARTAMAEGDEADAGRRDDDLTALVVGLDACRRWKRQAGYWSTECEQALLLVERAAERLAARSRDPHAVVSAE